MGNTLEQQPIFLNQIESGGERLETSNTQQNQGPVVEPTKTKKTKTFKNPTSLKKNTLRLERDALDKNLFYITFTYDSLNDFVVKIYFNATKCEYENHHFFPEEKFLNSIIQVNVEKGMKKHFENPKACLNLAEFFSNKVPIRGYFDVIISLHSQGKSGETVLATYCTIFGEKEALGKPGTNFELKVVFQELQIKGVWYVLHNLFHANEDNFSTNCVICFSSKRNTIFLPCKHSCCCKDCAESSIRRKIACALCRMDIYDMIIIDEVLKENEAAEKSNPNPQNVV